MTKYNLLTELDLSECSLVDKGANPGALIMLFKRREEAPPEPIDLGSARLHAAIVKSRLALRG